MTIYELMVIAVAAGVFMIINIIMWSVISHKEKKAAQKEKAAPEQKAEEKPVSAEPSGTTADEPDTIHHERPADFIIEENIVLIHTDEVL